MSKWYGNATNGHKNLIIGKLSRHGAKILAVRVIKQAVTDNDFQWICSKNSDLFFDLAGVTKEEIMNCFDDNLNLIRKKN